MVTKAFSTEDKNLNTLSVISARSANYKDIDLSLELKTSGDVYKKERAAAVKQSVKNIIMTNYFEKPFEPFFGANVQGLLFELANDTTGEEIKNNVKSAIEFYEPRAEIINLDVNSLPDNYSISVRLEFKIVNSEQTIVLQTSLSRLR
jgi:phage baseplate assembly protein W